MTRRKLCGALLLAVGARASNRLSVEEEIAPRSAILDGTANVPSLSGRYVVTFPPPNQCVVIHVAGSSRTQALYVAVSKGGFALKPGQGSLSVWTEEEWLEAMRRLPPNFGHCEHR